VIEFLGATARRAILAISGVTLLVYFDLSADTSACFVSSTGRAMGCGAA
jgi:hypothetical protein